jgi:hypothetical protein
MLKHWRGTAHVYFKSLFCYAVPVGNICCCYSLGVAIVLSGNLGCPDYCTFDVEIFPLISILIFMH